MYQGGEGWKASHEIATCPYELHLVAGMLHHKQRVFFKDLRVDSPYNTYRHFGLPPGAIASPGERSLKAALAPEKNDFIFYVARPNGSHYFTRTRQEHEAAIKLARSERTGVRAVSRAPAGNIHEPK